MAERKALDVNHYLTLQGYKARPDYKQIVQWAAAQRFTEVKTLLNAVEIEWGGPGFQKVKMHEDHRPYNLFQAADIQTDYAAIEQLETALRLPVAIGGAGMPDLHKGYSLPIGGVVVLEGAVSPAFVGYDIACQMKLTVFKSPDLLPEMLEDEEVRKVVLDWILKSTSFGLGASTDGLDHPVLHDPRWKEIPYLRGMYDLAASQLGSSGAGNHFADFVIGKFWDGDQFVGLMTHSGSRGVGNKAGHHYAELADQETSKRYSVPSGYGWLPLDLEAGQEYMRVMELMGDYAQANHDIIHQRFQKVSGLERVDSVSNKHNFAWNHDGYVIHRKGATPADRNVYGIIPGLSGSPAYLVLGKGNPDSWFSASHGAGRPHSRTKAKELYNDAQFKQHMSTNGITYYGVAHDETVAAYKPIEKVIDAQEDLIEVVAIMQPKVVVMGGNVHSDDGD